MTAYEATVGRKNLWQKQTHGGADICIRHQCAISLQLNGIKLGITCSLFLINMEEITNLLLFTYTEIYKNKNPG